MFVGHYGVGFALKRLDHALSLGLLFLAIQFSDILWPIFVLLGIEKFSVVPHFMPTSSFVFQYYPFSHSLVAALLWSALVFLAVRFIPGIKGNKILAGAVIATAVFSHYILDFIVHAPDLPLAGGNSAKIGLGLWNHYWLSILLEMVILFGGLWIYLRTTRGRSFWSKNGPVILAIFLVVMQITSTLGAPPNKPGMIATMGLAANLIIAALAFLIDRKRIPVGVRIVEERPIVVKK